MFQITLSKDNNANGGQRSESRPAVDVFLGREDLLLVGILLLQELLELFFLYCFCCFFQSSQQTHAKSFKHYRGNRCLLPYLQKVGFGKLGLKSSQPSGVHSVLLQLQQFAQLLLDELQDVGSGLGNNCCHGG